MGHPAGLRAGTRYAFSRKFVSIIFNSLLRWQFYSFRQKGMIKLSTYLRQYKVGDIVDIKANGAVQKGSVITIPWIRMLERMRILADWGLGAWKLTLNSMPHKVYHGKTGVVYNVTKSSVGVIVYKKVKHRYIEKRVNLRVEHVSLSRSREEFVRRVKNNAELKKKSKAEGTHVHLKRQPLMPRESRTISMKDNVPETVVPIAYETTI
jgi:large subunit ribosomal protein L21e